MTTKNWLIGLFYINGVAHHPLTFGPVSMVDPPTAFVLETYFLLSGNQKYAVVVQNERGKTKSHEVNPPDPQRQEWSSDVHRIYYYSRLLIPIRDLSRPRSVIYVLHVHIGPL